MGAFRTRSPKEGPSFLIPGVFTLFKFSKMSGRKFAQIVASAAANFGQMTNGFVCSITSFAIPQLISGEDTVQLTLEESSWFASMSALGAISGALLGGVSCEKLGRRWSMILDCLGYIIGFLLIGFGNNFPLLLFGRILTGHFAASNLVCCPIFVGETSHPSISTFNLAPPHYQRKSHLAHQKWTGRGGLPVTHVLQGGSSHGQGGT